MNQNKESKSLSRLITNLESDTDIQKLVQAKPAKQHTTDRLNAVKEAVFKKVQQTLAARPEAAATQSEDERSDQKQSLRATPPSESVIPFPSAQPLALAASSATEESTELTVAGKENVQVVVYHQSARLAVYDDKGDPSQKLDGYRIIGRTSGQANLHELGIISDWKAILPAGAKVDHLLPPDAGGKVALTSLLS